MTSRQFAGEPSRRLSVAGSYQRARASRTAASAGNLFKCVRQAISNGPPTQRIGTHASGDGGAETAGMHDNKKSSSRRENHAIANSCEVIDAEIFPTTNSRSGCGFECAQVHHSKAPVGYVAADSPNSAIAGHDKVVVLPGNESSNTPLRNRLGGICDSGHVLTV